MQNTEPSKKKMVYLAGKLTGWGRPWYYLVAWWYARILWRKGHIVYSPHWNAVFQGKILSYEEWLADDFAVITRCDAIAMLPNWTKSRGARRELKFALDRQMKIIYL